jgi:hypothetical protein
MFRVFFLTSPDRNVMFRVSIPASFSRDVTHRASIKLKPVVAMVISAAQNGFAHGTGIKEASGNKSYIYQPVFRHPSA